MLKNIPDYMFSVLWDQFLFLNKEYKFGTIPGVIEQLVSQRSPNERGELDTHLRIVFVTEQQVLQASFTEEIPQIVSGLHVQFPRDLVYESEMGI